jgi:hypothetical protein
MRPPSRPGTVGSRWYCKTSWLLLVVVFLCVCLLVVGNYALQLRRSCEAREASTLESLRTAQAYSTASEGEVKRLQAQVAYLTDSGANAPVEGARRRVAPPPGGGAGKGGEEGGVEAGGKQREGEEGKAGKGRPQQQQQQQQQQRHTGGGALVAGVERAPLRPAPRESWGVVASGVEASPVSPSSARALLVICYNRPAYLKRTLRAVLSRLPTYDRPHVYISQDGEDGEVSAAIGELAGEFAAQAPDVPFTHWHHPAVSPKLRGGGAVDGWALSYYKLAQHFGWALERLFSERNHPYVIVLEDDLEVAVDFFQYFSAMAPLLDADDTLLAVSSYSDLGQPAFVGDPRQVHRSDFFPGLGWMLNRRVWKQDLGPKWPDSFWDDWLREPPQRKGRHILRPEVRHLHGAHHSFPYPSTFLSHSFPPTPPLFPGFSHPDLWREWRVPVPVLLPVPSHSEAQ